MIATQVVSGPQRFFANWLLWFLFLLTVAVGCLFMVALEHLAGSKWSVPIRRVPEHLAGLIVLVIPMGIVSLFSLKNLYPLAQPHGRLPPEVAGKSHPGPE